MTGGVLFTSSICVIQAAWTEEHSLQHRCIMGERYQFLSQLFSPCGMSSRWPQTLPSRYGLYGSSFLAIAFVGSPVNPSDEILHRWNLYVTACSKTSTWTRWQRSVRQYSHDSHVCFVHRKFVLSPAASHWATDSVGWRIRVLFFGSTFQNSTEIVESNLFIFRDVFVCAQRDGNLKLRGTVGFNIYQTETQSSAAPKNGAQLAEQHLYCWESKQ